MKVLKDYISLILIPGLALGLLGAVEKDLDNLGVKSSIERVGDMTHFDILGEERMEL